MCRTVYVETFPREMLFQPDVLVKANTSVACQYIVCPSLQSGKQDMCTIEVGPPSLGATDLKVILFDTIGECNARFWHRSLYMLYKVESQTASNWPFGLVNDTKTSYAWFNLSQIREHKYFFLHRGNAGQDIHM